MKKDQEEIQAGSFGGNPDGARVDFDAARDKAKPEPAKSNPAGPEDRHTESSPPSK